MKRDERIDVRVSPLLRDALQEAADADGRSLAGMVNRILENWRSRRALAKAHEQATHDRG